jgi:hypothetical protein
MPPQSLQAPPDWGAGYRAEQERSRAELNQRANYASAIAEALGHYTPELQQEVLAPMGQYPTIGENLLSAPVRGLGKLFGNQAMQQYGAPQEFQLTGQPEAPPVMPPLPAGIPEDMRNFMEQMATSQGYMKPGQKQVTPNIPSEYSSSTPMLKTKAERERQASFEKNMWDVIGKQYQSQLDQDTKRAMIENYQAQAANLKQSVIESQEKLKLGPTPSEWTILNTIFKEHPELDKLTIMREFMTRGLDKNPSAEIQLFNLSKQQGYGGNIAQFRALMKKASMDPARVVYEAALEDPLFSLRFKDPQKRMEELQRRTIEFTQLMNYMNTGEFGALTGGEGGLDFGAAQPQAKSKGRFEGRGKSPISGAWALEQMKPGTIQQPGASQQPTKVTPGAAEAKKAGKPAPQVQPGYSQSSAIPQELKVMGVTDQDLENLIRDEARKGRQVNQSQAAEMMMNYFRMMQSQGR